MKLYKKTVMTREQLIPRARVVLRPETGAPEGSYRKVQIVVPQSPQVFCVLDREPQRGFTEDGFASDRNYQLPFLQPGQRTVFMLAPDQMMSMSCETEMAAVSIICEYVEG